MTNGPKATPNYNTHIPPEILTPDKVESSVAFWREASCRSRSWLLVSQVLSGSTLAI